MSGAQEKPDATYLAAVAANGSFIENFLEHFKGQHSDVGCTFLNKVLKVSGSCPADYDSVLCWPPTPSNSAAVLPCFDQFNGIKYDTTQNATRWCFENSSWEKYTDYSKCSELAFTEPEVELTTTIYFIGYSVSLIALVFASTIFWKFKDLKCLRNTVHINLMLTYILADFTWIIAFALQLISENEGLCMLLTILLHYFNLTNFFWMFVEGLYLYTLVVKTFSGEYMKLKIYVIIGWGIPFIFVVIWGITKSFSLTSEDVQNERILRSCPWTQDASDMIYQAPAMAVLVINLLFLAKIMWVLITKLRSTKSAETRQYRKATKALLVLIPLLGVTYMLVLVGPTDGISKRIYDNVRAFLLSTQGFSVALFYCFLNAEVKNTISHRFSSWKTKRAIGSERRSTRSSRSSRCSSRNWSQRSSKSKGESFRLYNRGNSYRKRESTCSQYTTATLVTLLTGKQTPLVRSPLSPKDIGSSMGTVLEE